MKTIRGGEKMGERELNQSSFRVKVKVIGDELVVGNGSWSKSSVRLETPDTDYLLVITEDPDGPLKVVCFSGFNSVELRTNPKSWTPMCFLPDDFLGKNICREVFIIPPEQKFHWTDFAHITPP
ncbi:hypothetical protein A2567_03200 [Candidatus Azambacteria bacterium RIFOXYD1_FULL_42_11]|uniref:Uncharacterized protein n=3 Tax=Candidatus Azamiibacteriota TaxID=1752741 RepID=A0A1F5CGQ1_9BACT|nr:MAG: hypothetical protein A2567_03200 [Candidatus Azambacteria bacterium RIFOXYD1_FULL_42_11]